MISNEPCFVLIRGLLREQRHWGSFIQVLQQAFPKTKIITLDIPGNGQLNQQTSPANIAALTDALRLQLPPHSTINLIALSMGGMIALDWMNRYPTEIHAAILINTSVRPYSPFYHRLRWQAYPSILKTLTGTPELAEENIFSFTSNLHPDKEKTLANWLQWRTSNPVSKLSAIRQLWAAAKFKMQDKPLHPVLIVCCKQDQLVNYRCSLKLHRVWGCDYQQHETAGHDLSLDDPQWLADIIQRWISHL